MTTPLEPSESHWRDWIAAIRVPTLPAAVVPVLVGTALAVAGRHFRPGVFVATVAASLLIQIGTNLANDYFDFQSGADDHTRVGPRRITAGRGETVLRAALATFGAAAALGVYLSIVGGWPILLIGLASILAGIAYTGGPYPLGYHGLGDLFTFVFFGVLAVCGTYYLQTGSLSSVAVLASVPVGCLVTAILVVNNIRDADTDRVAHKMTLAAALGRPFARAEYDVLVLGSYVFPISMLALGAATPWLFWLPFLSLPLALLLIRTVATTDQGPPLNRALRGTGRLHLMFGSLFALSLLK